MHKKWGISSLRHRFQANAEFLVSNSKVLVSNMTKSIYVINLILKIRENPRFQTFFTVNRPFFLNFYSTTRNDCEHSQSWTYNPIGGVGWRFFPLNSFRLFHCCFSVRVPYKTSFIFHWAAMVCHTPPELHFMQIQKRISFQTASNFSLNEQLSGIQQPSNLRILLTTFYTMLL